MNTKTVVSSFIIIVVVLVILVVGFYALQTYQQRITPAPQNQQPQTQAPQVQDKTITDNTAPFSIQITYPAITGADAFNQKVEAAVTKEISDFKKNSLENDAAVKKNDPESYAKYPRKYDLIISYTKGQIDSDVISVMLNVENFEGGAHGAHYFIPINYNVKTGQEIALADLFPGQTDYLQKISDFCTTDLKKQLTAALGSLDGTWITDGAGPKAENFQVFLVNKDSITFYFSEYQVAPYVAGSFQVVIPR